MPLLLIFIVGVLYSLYGMAALGSGDDIYIFTKRGSPRLDYPEELWAAQLYFGCIWFLTLFAGFLLFGKSYPDHPVGAIAERIRIALIKWNKL